MFVEPAILQLKTVKLKSLNLLSQTKKKKDKGEITSHQSPLDLQSSENIQKVRRFSWCSHAYVHLDKI